MAWMNKIRTVARFEMKTLFRSWFFRIFTVLTLLMLLGMNIGMLTEGGDVSWAIRSITSNIPYMNMAFLNIAQALLAIFLASDFLKRDKKLDTTEVIYTRSMTNWEYVWGKTLGVLVVFAVLNLLVLLMALIINMVVSGVAVDWAAYLIYPLIIGLPTLLFTLGLAFFLMSVIRNQAVTLVVLIGLAAVSLFFVQGKVDHLFDYMVFTFPMMRSDIIGSGLVEQTLLQRATYLFTGAGLIFATILLLKRLSQSRPFSILAFVLMIVFLAVGLGSGVLYFNRYQSVKAIRAEARELNDAVRDLQAVSLHKADLIVEHADNKLSVKALLTLSEEMEELPSELIFSLNPGLNLTEVLVDAQEVDFTRKQHLVRFNTPADAQDGSVVTFTYEGTIDERICYLDVKDTDLTIKHGPNFIIASPKRHAVVSPDYVLLTPECLWYPVAGGTFGSNLAVAPARQFTRYSLEVRTDPVLTAVSQGESQQNDGQWTFESDHRFTGLSLVIGAFETLSLDLDSIRVELSYIPDHDSYLESLQLLSDTLPVLVRETFLDYERSLGLSYPFNFLKLVEAPVQLFAYDRVWAKNNEYVQPGMVLFPENLIWFRRGDVRKELEDAIDRAIERDEASSDEDIQAQVFSNLVRTNLIGGQSNFRIVMRGSGRPDFSMTDKAPWSVYANYFAHANYFFSDRFPMVTPALEAYIQTQTGQVGGFGRNMGGVSDEEKASLALKDQSFFDLLNSDDEKNMLPIVIQAKGKQLFNFLEASVGSEEFTAFIRQELTQSRFLNQPFSALIEKLENTYELDLGDYLETWYYGTEVPSFLVTDVKNFEIQEGDHTVYQLFFTLSNTGNSDGVVNVSFRSGGRGGMGGGGFGMRGGGSPQQTYVLAGRDEATDRLLYIPAETAYRFAFLMDDPTRMMTVNTLISSNLPSSIMYPFPDVEPRRMEGVEGVFETELVTTLALPHELIVDNEDPSFSIHEEGSSNRLSRLLGIDVTDTEFAYQSMNFWRPPMSWTLTTSSGFYGDYIRSAHYTRSGEGERYVEWEVDIPESGYYDVSVYLDDMIARMGRFRGRGGDRGGPGGGSGGGDDIKDVYHYMVTHDEGEDEVSKALSNIEDGWNMLGSFYFSQGKARVRLTNENTGKIVVADAVRWIKQN